MSDLALIAGQGRLPELLFDALAEAPFVAAMDGFPPEGLVVDQVFRFEHLGTFLAGLTGRGCKRVCFAGSMARPPVEPGLIDAATMPLVPRLMAAMGQGDDALLREVLAVFGEAGLTVVAADEILPELVPEAGLLGAVPLSDRAEAEADRAAAIVAAMGGVDIGQGCVVHKGQALAVEGLFGTDWMLESLRARPDGAGGVFFKAPKPGQDRRIDLPAIGPETIMRVAAAGLDGLVIEAGGVMVLDREAVIAAADRAGLFLWARSP